MKKRILAMIFATFMVLAAAGCGSSSDSSTGSAASSSETVENSDKSGSSEEAASSSVEGDLGDYHVRIKKGTMMEDYEGNPALRIEFSYTNNSDDAMAFDTAVYPKAFQDGVELEHAYSLDGDDAEWDNSMKEIKPGVTITCAQYFLLDNTDSPVEMEVTELISLSDKTLTKTFDLK